VNRYFYPHSIVEKQVVPPRVATSTSAAARILLVNDTAAFRERLAKVIHGDPLMDICGEAEGPRQAEEVIAASQPDLIVLLARWGDTMILEWLTALQSRENPLPVLVLTGDEQPAFTEAVLRAGARGCVPQKESDVMILDAIRDVLAGQVSVSPAMASTLLRRMTTPTADSRVSRLALLSERELEIFRLLAAGQKTRNIAKTLHLSESTVNSHCFRIRRKLDIKNAAQLHYFATQWAGK
jgi:DNA-binding NarL/FixJ family response regulator